jgi:hypothetical protein
MTRERIASSPVWYLKNCWSCNAVLNEPGKPPAIKLITDYASYVKARDETEHHQIEVPGPDDRNEPIQDFWFLQRGVCNPHLIDGKKYVLKVYYLTLGDGRVYLYNDCLGYAHASPFDVRSTERQAHISSFSVYSGEQDERTGFALSNLPEYERIFGHIVENSKKHSVIWADTARKSLENPDESLRMDRTRYHIWSASHVVMADLTSYLLGLKAYPNLNHHVTAPRTPARPHEHEFRLKGFDRDILRILGVDDGGVPPETPLTWVDVTWAGVGAQPVRRSRADDSSSEEEDSSSTGDDEV